MTAFLFAGALIFSGCAVQESVHTRDGKKYGQTSGLFRDRWWNYYERGLSLAEGEFYDEAIQDINSAIEQRRDDQWRSRTYGMHFIDYFPHRELGIIYFKLNKFDDAIRELEYSVHSAESAKAKYFLNRTRESILNQTGADKLPPSIRIDYPSDGTITNKSSITIIGQAEDDYYVSSVSVNDNQVPLSVSAKNIVLEQEVGLNRGPNEIRVRAADLTGKTLEKVVTVHSDRNGPLIIIEDQMTDGRKVILSGLVTDDTEITSLIINGQALPVNSVGKPVADSAGREVEFYREIEIPEGKDTIVISAEDIAMNITKGVIRVNHSESGLNHLPLLASSQPVRVGFTRERHAFNGGVIAGIIDDAPPRIDIKDLPDVHTVYTDLLYIEGSVSDDSKITSLTVNGEPVLRRKGKKVFFSYLNTLSEGENKLSVEAADVFGNKSEKVVIVNRKIPRIRKVGSRMSMSVLPFERKGEGSVAGDTIVDGLISAFLEQKRFNLIERQKMEEVLRELRLGQTELADPGTASRLGKLMVADTILTGAIYESNDSIEIFTRLVDTETSVILEAHDVFDEDKSFQGIKRLMQGLASKYRQSFPLVEGLIINKSGKILFTDIGEDKKVKKHMGLILFREGEKITHPLSKEILGSEPEELGEAKIDKVDKGFSRALITKGKPAGIRINDRVITK